MLSLHIFTCNHALVHIRDVVEEGTISLRRVTVVGTVPGIHVSVLPTTVAGLGRVFFDGLVCVINDAWCFPGLTAGVLRCQYP